MRRVFVQNIFFLILINLIVKPLWIFGIDRNVQIAVGHEVYGEYGALLNFSLIFQVLLDFGLQSYNNRTIAQSPEAMTGLFPNIIIAKGVLSLGYILLVCLLGLVLGYRGYSFFLLVALCFVQVLNSFLLYLRSNVSAMHLFRTDSMLSVSDRFFMILICSVLLFHPFFAGSFKIEWFIYAQIVAYLLTSAIAFVICTRLAKLDWSHYDLKKVWLICRHSLPYALLIFFMAIYIRSDVFLIERLLPEGKYEAGVYAAAYRFLDVSNNVTGVLFAGILLPLFGRMLARKEAIQPLVRLSINLLLPVSITAMLIAFFFGGQIMFVQLKDIATPYDGKVFSLLMAAFPGYCIGYVYATLLTANGNIKPLIFVAAVAVLLNLILNIIFVPLYGAWGGALSCCITQCYLSVANISLAKKMMHLKTDWNWMLRYPVFVLIVLVTCYFISRSHLVLLAQLGAVGGVAGISMFVCGFLPFGKIKELLLNR